MFAVIRWFRRRWLVHRLVRTLRQAAPTVSNRQLAERIIDALGDALAEYLERHE